MSALAFIGDPLRCAGFRLAGFTTWSPAPGGETAALEAALAAAQAVFIGAEVASRLPRARLDAALATGTPPLAILPDDAGMPSALDPAERVRTQLGLER